MKKELIVAALCFVLCISAKTQCDKTIKWTSGKSEFIDASGNIEHAKVETVELTAGKKKISIVLHDESMSGDVSDYSCNWKDKQNGKMVLKSVLLDTKGKTRHATITIEAVNGKTTILLQAEEEPDKIRLSITSFEEVK